MQTTTATMTSTTVMANGTDVVIPPGGTATASSSRHSSFGGGAASGGPTDHLIPPPPRSESMAYPKANRRSMMSKFQYYLRQHTRAVGATIAFVTFVLVITSDYLHDAAGNAHGSGVLNRSSGASTSFGGFRGSVRSYLFGAFRPGYFSVEGSIKKNGAYSFAMVTDLDQLSFVETTKRTKPKFQSHMAIGTLQKNANPASLDQTYTISFDENTPVRHLTTKHNEAGRGAELSELTVFDNRLLAFDDRTGDVFEILNTADGQDSYIVPRLVITEGDGDTDKGMKWEWSTVKDGELYMGSMGKEFTDHEGNVQNVNNLWIAVLNGQTGLVRRVNWRHVYNVVRQALGATSPGYIITEAVNWSPHLQQWVFLPRRISSEMYDDEKDEKRGGRKLVLVSPDFTTTQVIDLKVKSPDPLKGWSSFSFVPGTGDLHLLGIRSVEEDCAGDDLSVCKQRSYVVVMDVLTGEQLSPEIKYEQDWKFEGLEFFDPHVKPPPV